MPDNLVYLRSGGTHSTALVHPASGLITAFRELAVHLPVTENVIAFENPEPAVDMDCSVGALGADYWRQLSFCLEGPLLLAGWSFGGPVALTMAGLAEAAGYPLDAVALIDSGPPHLLRSREDGLLSELADLFGIKGTEIPAGPPPKSEQQALDLICEVLGKARGMPGIDAADLRPFVETYRWHVRAMRHPWHFAGCAAPVILIRARGERGWRDAPRDLGWSQVLGGSPEILWTEGTHDDLMAAENAPYLAALLSSCAAARNEIDQPWPRTHRSDVVVGSELLGLSAWGIQDL